MNALDRKKLQLTVIKAEAAKAELEYKILEREEDIQRIKDHIALQDKIIEEAKEKLQD